MDVKTHKKKQKISKSKKKESAEEEVSGIADDDELLSLTHSVRDEEKLVNLMFSAIQGTKLEAMLPPVLKAIPLNDLKLLCIHELRGISRKRIAAIIEGKVMSDSSGSSDEEDEESSGLEDKHNSSSSKRSGSNKNKQSRTVNGEKCRTDESGKPMDIVELEMRARLIETMLKNNPKQNGATSVSDIANIKKEPLSDRSRSRSYSGSRSRSTSYSSSRSRSYSRSSRSSSYSSAADGKSKRKRHSSHHKSRRDRHGRRKRRRGSSSKKREDSQEPSVTPDRNVDNDDKKRQAKKTKISRKEFECRMKKAKENRTYRKRKESDDENKPEEVDENVERISKRRRRSGKIKIKSEPVDKEPGEESEREEGEIDSNEEEGAYSDRRSRSRSNYSSRSASDYSNGSRSTSRKRSKRKKDKKRSRKDARQPVDKKLIIATLNEEGTQPSTAKSTVDKSKSSMEAVDSEEDFDSMNVGGAKSAIIDDGTHMVPRTDRTNVSFSFNKKTQPTLVQGTDLEFGMSFGRPSQYKPPQPSRDQIVISSDSEKEERSNKTKSRKTNKPAEKASNNPSDIHNDTNARSPDKDFAPNISDQSDLKLCEETVIKDIFADIEEDEENTRHEVKKELLIKPEPSEEEESVNMNVSIEITSEEHCTVPTDKHGKKSKRRSIDDSTDSNINESDIRVKKEMLSPRNEEECSSHHQRPLESEILATENSTRVIAADRNTRSSKKSKASKRKSKINKSPNTDNSEMDAAQRCNDSHSYNISQTQQSELVNEREDGACTDQETDMNESLIRNDSTLITKQASDVSPSPVSRMDHHVRKNDTEANDQNDLPNLVDHSFEELNRTRETGNVENTTGEEEGGLVDLPENEHFEIEDDDDSAAVNKYATGGLEGMDHDMEDSEATNDKTDFYRGMDGLEFSKESSRTGLDDETSQTDSPSAKPFGILVDEGELEEVGAEDGGLVELAPEDAEALSLALDSSLPVRKQGNTEIIGEIEPSNNAMSNMGNLGESGSSWSTRWLQSEKVQKVVSSSKILSRMRNRIKKDRKDAKAVANANASISVTRTAPTTATVSEESPAVKVPESSSVPVIGSMEEYQRMLALQEKQESSSSSDPVPAPQAAAPEPAVVTVSVEGGSSSDSEEDELWSKMMGGTD